MAERYDWLLVVRNPFDRMLSEFYCKWGGVGKDEGNTMSKKKFNHELTKLIKEHVEDEGIGGHYTPQSEYVPGEAV